MQGEGKYQQLIKGGARLVCDYLPAFRRQLANFEIEICFEAQNARENSWIKSKMEDDGLSNASEKRYDKFKLRQRRRL